MTCHHPLAEYDPNTPQLVGLSGGQDSAGLAVWLHHHRGECDLRMVHVRHGLRDDAADAAAARAIAQHLGRPFIEVPAAWPKVHRPGGPEDAARQARYAAFHEVAETLGARVLYLGHTADDQAETVIMRLIRGTGPAGIAGMAASTRHGRLQVLRPLLTHSRAQVRAMAAGLPTVEDPTNHDMAQQRAFIRHKVMPRLAQARPDGQSATSAIQAFAELISQQNYLLEHLLGVGRLPTWGFVTRIPECLLEVQSRLVPASEEMVQACRRWLIHHVLGVGATRSLVGRIDALRAGERLDLPNNHWAAADKFGTVIGQKDCQWEIQPGCAVPGSPARVTPSADPISACPMPWSIALATDSSLGDLAVRLREPQDSVHKKIFNQFPKSLREQLPVVYTRTTGEVVAIGPISLQQSDLPLAAIRWVRLTPKVQTR